MSDNAQLPIPREMLEPYLKQAVAASIMQLMGDNGMKFVAAAVQNSLQQKVNARGQIDSSSYQNDTPFVEWLARDVIHKIARETVNGLAESLRPSIEEAVKKNLQKSTNVLAKTLVEGMVKSLSSEWAVKISVDHGKQ
jgi:uncharacterized membrane-anchored protein